MVENDVIAAEQEEMFQRIATFYEGRVQQYGHDPRACDYGSARSQRMKFQVLSEVMPLTDKRVLDVGCGFADFADFLGQRWGTIGYEGIDIAPAMIEQAQRLRPQLSLRVANLLDAGLNGPYDLVTANGIFYLLGPEAPGLMRRLIERMYALTGCAVAFNSLSTWADRQEAGEFYAGPLETLDFCRQLTPRVVLRHDYLPHDFTIYMYRPEAAP